MAIMYPKNISEYMPTESERVVYNELKNQLPDSYEVFYSVEWSQDNSGRMKKSEADFIVTHPDYGYICLEVKGGSNIYIQDNDWYVEDSKYGSRKLSRSPYKQAEESMYYFKDLYAKAANIRFNGIYAAGAVFPFFNISNLGTEISYRQASCTIDSTKMQDLHKAIKAIFRTWGGQRFGLDMYSRSEHAALMELIKKRIAISAAAGALVKYKDQQMDIINRVQDNYIYFLTNYEQFYIRGGAGTGKTWIAIKMANQEAQKGNKVLITCASNKLAAMIRENVLESIEVRSLDELLAEVIEDYNTIDKSTYENVFVNVKKDVFKYDAIFIDEAQDLNEEIACVIKYLLKDERHSRLGIFYDDVQRVSSENLEDIFMIEAPPFLLRENIRNTSNIYDYAMENTNLGRDVIRNPVEGPTPMKEFIRDRKHLTQRLENLLKEFIIDENLSNSSIVILFENMCDAENYLNNGLAQWKFVNRRPVATNEIQTSSAFDFKGLESDMVIYVRRKEAGENINYIAYTRAKYYLYELII